MRRKILEQIKFDELENFRIYLNSLKYYVVKEKENMNMDSYISTMNFLNAWTKALDDMTDYNFSKLEDDINIKLVCDKYWKEILEEILTQNNN